MNPFRTSFRNKFQKNSIKRHCRTAKNTLGKRVCKCRRSFCYYRNYTHLFASAAGKSVQIQRENGAANTSVTTTTVTLMYFNRHYLQKKNPHTLIDQSGFQPNYSHFKWKILLTLSELKPVSQQAVAQTCLKPCHGWSLSIRASGDLTEVVGFVENLSVKSCGLQ